MAKQHRGEDATDGVDLNFDVSKAPYVDGQAPDEDDPYGVRELTEEQEEALRNRVRSRQRKLGDFDEDHHGDSGPKQLSLPAAVAAGFINYLLMFGLSCCYGMIMFQDSWNAQHIALGIKMNCFTCMWTGGIMAWFSKIPIAIGGPDLNPVYFLGGFMNKITRSIAASKGLKIPAPTKRRLFEDDGSMSISRWLSSAAAPAVEFCVGDHLAKNFDACTDYHQSLRATAIFTTFSATLILAIVFFLLGWLKLSRYVSYVPANIVDAFLSCVGYKVFKYAITFCNFDALQFLPAAAIGVPVYFLMANHIGNPAILMPLGLIAPLIVFYIVIYARDLPVAVARAEHNLFFPTMKDVEFYRIWTDSIGNASKIDFQAWIGIIPDLLTMVVVIVMDCLFKINATEYKLPIKTQKNYEVQLDGMQNFMNALFGSTVGYMQLKFNVISYGILRNVQDRRAGLIYSALSSVGFFITIQHFNFLPRFFLSALLFFAGAGFVCENLWGSRKYLNLREWIEILIILVVFIIWTQMIYAVIVGFILVGISFVVKYAKVPAIAGRAVRGHEVLAHEVRNELVQRSLSHVARSWFMACKLKGFVFFGSIQYVTDYVMTRIQDEVEKNIPEYRRMKYFVFDCSMLDGMDVSAAKAIKKLAGEAEDKKVRVLWTNVSPVMVKELKARGTIKDESSCFADLDQVILHIEEQIIRYWTKLQRTWCTRHPTFALFKEMYSRRSSMDPFQHVLLTDASRFGCPWQYCSSIKLRKFRTVLWHKGEINGVIYLVHTGAVGLYREMPPESGEGGWKTPALIYRQGAFLNIETLVRRPNLHHAIALEDGEILCWTTEQWRRMSREQPNMRYAIMCAAMRQRIKDSQHMASAVHPELETESPPEALHSVSQQQMTADQSPGHAAMASLVEPQTTPRSKTFVFKERNNRQAELPEDLLVTLHEMEAAGGLAEMGLYQIPNPDEVTTLPDLPPPLEVEAMNAFNTYCDERSGRLAWVKVPEALMYAGIFNTALAPRPDLPDLSRSEFLMLAHEAAMSRLTRSQIQTLRDLFRRFDEDKSGTLELPELARVFQNALHADLSVEEVDGIAEGWKCVGDSWGEKRVTEEIFLAIMSRYVKKHEFSYMLLRGILEMTGGTKYDESLVLTAESLWESEKACLEAAAQEKQQAQYLYAEGEICYAGKETEDPVKAVEANWLSQENLEELLWAADWRQQGAGEGKELEFSCVVGAVTVNLEKPRGSVPPPPKSGSQQWYSGATKKKAPASRFWRRAASMLDDAPQVASEFRVADFLLDLRDEATISEAAELLRQQRESSVEASGDSESKGLLTSETGRSTSFEYVDEVPSWDLVIYRILNVRDSSDYARWYWQFSGLMIIISSLAIFLEPVIALAVYDPTNTADKFWFVLELIFTVFFSLEYLARLIVAPAGGTDPDSLVQKLNIKMSDAARARLQFIITPVRICDFVSCLPFYAFLIVSKYAQKEVQAVQIVTLARLARIASLTRHNTYAPPVAVVLVVIWFIFLYHHFA